MKVSHDLLFYFLRENQPPFTVTKGSCWFVGADGNPPAVWSRLILRDEQAHPLQMNVSVIPLPLEGVRRRRGVGLKTNRILPRLAGKHRNPPLPKEGEFGAVGSFSC